jgi:glycosyltransferase involved in cell wall biosynthesis
MRSLIELGHQVSFGSLGPIDARATDGLAVTAVRDLLSQPRGEDTPILSGLQERFRSYWGIETRAIREVGRFAEDLNADAVVLSGLDILPCLGGVKRGVRVWYAGDEWARHHLSLIHWRQPESWKNLKPALIKGVYEWAFARDMDRVWVVSNDERRAVHRISRKPQVDVVANGVDVNHFAPSGGVESPMSACFWGRLDFEPNIDAVVWFCREVWPLVHASEGRAVFTVYGFQPTPVIERVCATTPGVRLVPDLPDLRDEIGRQAVVVLPFVSGGGIKNKLLEACALARPVVGSPKACEGLLANAPVIQASRPEEWVTQILGLWRDDARRLACGAAAREWVSSAHSWMSAAREAARGIEATLAQSSAPRSRH